MVRNRRPFAAAAVFVALSLVLGAAGLSGAAPAPGIRVSRPTGAAPGWWTPELRAQVIAAGSAGVPVPDDGFVVPMSSTAFLGIRPGQLLLVNTGDGTSLCTSNFVFASGTGASTKYYVGTAGHCGVVGNPAFMVYLPKGLVNIGTIVKSTGDPGDDPSKTDFALIAISPALYADISPSMAYWGGPTGVFTGSGIQPILHAGWGLVVGTGGTPRAGVAHAWRIGSEYRFQGVVAPVDSGSGAIVAGGLAAGNIAHLAANTGQFPPAWNGGTTMTAILAYIGTGYRLVTCRTATPWPLTGCPPV